MKRIGIIGGMGPLATIDLYTKIMNLTPAKIDQEHIPVIIDIYPQIEDRTDFILNNSKNPKNKLIESALRLQNCGADAIIMACNTAHYFAKDIENSINIPFIHIVKTSVKAIKNNYPKAKNIILIATDGTKKGNVYEDILLKDNFNIVSFDDNIQKDIMSCIYDGVKAGKTSKYISLFQKCIDKICELQPDIIIAACTEISILFNHIKCDLPVIDATLELAKESVKFSLKS